MIPSDPEGSKCNPSRWPSNGGRAHYVMVSKVQWKPFWLATQLSLQDDWLGGKTPYTTMYEHSPHSTGFNGHHVMRNSSICCMKLEEATIPVPESQFNILKYGHDYASTYKHQRPHNGTNNKVHRGGWRNANH